ncbi:unnamed protein product, partial [Symbiodinium microadriaticum]
MVAACLETMQTSQPHQKQKESPWDFMETRIAQAEEATQRLRRQLAIHPPVLDTVTEQLGLLRRHQKELKDWTLESIAQSFLDRSNSAAWELAVLRPEMSALKSQVEALKEENGHLTSQLGDAQRRESEVQQMIGRAKSRNGRLLLEVEEMRQQLEAQKGIQELAERLRDELCRAERAATDAEMECDSLRKQLEGSGQRQSSDTDADDNAEELRERLMEMQEALNAARDRATDAEMECEDLRKQLQLGQTARASAEREGDDDSHLFEKL